MRMQQVAEELAAENDKLLPRARALAPLQADHLERSCDSLLFNMAEGIACFKPKMKISAYDISRKEGNEYRAVLRRLNVKGVYAWDEIKRAHELAGVCIAMLTNATISVEKRLPQKKRMRSLPKR
jgi:four helix bundle protein